MFEWECVGVSKGLREEFGYRNAPTFEILVFAISSTKASTKEEHSSYICTFFGVVSSL